MHFSDFSLFFLARNMTVCVCALGERVTQSVVFCLLREKERKNVICPTLVSNRFKMSIF